VHPLRAVSGSVFRPVRRRASLGPAHSFFALALAEISRVPSLRAGISAELRRERGLWNLVPWRRYDAAIPQNRDGGLELRTFGVREVSAWL
jgi:hypothetical protein